MKRSILKNHRLRALLPIAAFVLGVANPAVAGTSDFPGRWVNADANTRGVAYVIVSSSPAGLSLDVFGSCHPTACDWGVVQAHIYTAKVGDDPTQMARAITGNYDHGFAHTEIVLEEINPNDIRYETFTHFSDSSGRSDYIDWGIFKRSAN